MVFSPLTLIGSWMALRGAGARSGAIRAGASANLLVLVAGLALLTAVWGLKGPIVIAWVVLVILVVLLWPSCTPIAGRGGGVSQATGRGSREATLPRPRS